jgi:hypothetical protein
MRFHSGSCPGVATRLYIEDLQRQLAVAAEAGGEDARALAERLVAPLDAAIRLTLQDVLAAAAAAVERTGPARPRERRAFQGAQRYTGWAR